MTPGLEELKARLRDSNNPPPSDPLAEAALTAIEQLEARIADLEGHIGEQATHVETRIQDGIEMGATVWRIALEDVARENRQALERKPDVASNSTDEVFRRAGEAVKSLPGAIREGRALPEPPEKS